MDFHENQLAELRAGMIREALAAGNIVPVGSRKSLQESFTKIAIGSATWLTLWYNDSAGSTRVVRRRLSDGLAGRVDRNGNIVRPLALGEDLMLAAKEAFETGATEFSAVCEGGFDVTIRRAA